jgi:hypothetical protein
MPPLPPPPPPSPFPPPPHPPPPPPWEQLVGACLTGACPPSWSAPPPCSVPMPPPHDAGMCAQRGTVRAGAGPTAGSSTSTSSRALRTQRSAARCWSWGRATPRGGTSPS